MTDKPLSERVAEVERERDELRKESLKDTELLERLTRIADQRYADIRKLRLQLAAAERKATEAAREALTRLAEHFQRIEHPVYVINIEVFRDREYPAPTECEGKRCAWSCAKCGQSGEAWTGCGMSECEANVPESVRRAELATRYGWDRPTLPQAAPEPEPMRVYVERQQLYPQVQSRATGDWITLTPEDCRRIVAMAAVHVPEEGGR